MKIKKILIGCGVFFFLMLVMIFVVILNSDEEDLSDSILNGGIGLNLSAEVLGYQQVIEKYAAENNISEYVNYLLAIMQVESGGRGQDVMQSSESAGKEKDSFTPEESIAQACKYFSGILKKAEQAGCDIYTVIQAYNYGGRYIDYISENGKKHTFELAQMYAMDKSGGKTVQYHEPLAVQVNGGWRYDYGNMFYVELVKRYLFVSAAGDEIVQAVFDEALKYQGWKYVFGGSNPNTSFDCSGLVQWCFLKAGIELPRTAQEQYDTTQHIPPTEWKQGDLIFFQSTYNSGTFITHVGIYAGEGKMYHAGKSGIGYADITTEYWQEHLVSGGRIITGQED